MKNYIKVNALPKPLAEMTQIELISVVAGDYGRENSKDALAFMAAKVEPVEPIAEPVEPIAEVEPVEPIAEVEPIARLYTHTQYLELEDYLQNFEMETGEVVFHWMYDKTDCRHSDSYGTCLSYIALKAALDVAPFPKELIIETAKIWWLGNQNTGIPYTLAAFEVLRRWK